MDKLQELLNWAQEQLRSCQNAGDPYVADEFYDRYYDGQCEAFEEMIEEIKSMIRVEISNFHNEQQSQ